MSKKNGIGSIDEIGRFATRDGKWWWLIYLYEIAIGSGTGI